MFLSIPPRIIRLLIVLFVLSGMLTLIFSPSVSANFWKGTSEIPRAVVIDRIEGSGHYFRSSGGRTAYAQPNDKFAHDKRYSISGSSNKKTGAHLKFLSQSNDIIKGFIAVAGFSRSYAEYRYPCNGSGSFTIGWNAGINSQGCKKIVYNGHKLWRNSVRPKAEIKEDLNFENHHYDGGVIGYRKQACSVSTKSGNQWKIKTGGLEDQPDVCEQALSDCQSEFGEACSISARADWRDYDPDSTTLTAALECDDEISISKKVSGYSLEERDIPNVIESLQEKAKSQNAKACSLRIYSPSQVLIEPNSPQRTLVHADSTDDGFQVQDLAGSIKIYSSEDIEQTEKDYITLSAGESYRYIRSQKIGVKEPIPRKECKQVLEYPVIKQFLNREQWLDEQIQPEIPKYKQALDEEFYRSPSTSVERLSNAEGWSTSIELTDPLFTMKIERNRGQSIASISEKPGTLVMGGVYRTGKWELISQGQQLSRGQIWGKEYSVLAIDKDNQPLLITQSDGKDSHADWSEYKFALQAGPRLVRSGEASITQESAVKEGHRSLDIFAETRRAGIGLSEDKTRLHYIVADGVSLPRLAQLMAEKGVYDGMALDGGSGPAIAHSGIAQVPLESNQTFFIIAQAGSDSSTGQYAGCK